MPGLLTAYRAGHLSIANAIGTGIADDKSIYPYVPDMVRFYLDEEPLLANVRTWVLRAEADRAYVLAHLDELVVKEVHGAGGYGMLIGPAASRARDRGLPHPHPRAPGALHRAADAGAFDLTHLLAQGLAPRHIDLRPFVLSGREVTVVPGGLTRVALHAGLARGELLAGRRHQGHLGARCLGRRGGGC